MNKKIFSFLLCSILCISLFSYTVSARRPDTKLQELVDEWNKLMEEYNEWQEETGINDLREEHQRYIEQIDWDKVDEFYDKMWEIREEYEEEYDSLWDEYQEKERELDEETGIAEIKDRINELREEDAEWEEIWKLYEEIWEIREEYEEEYDSLWDEYQEKERELDEETGIAEIRDKIAELTFEEETNKIWEKIFSIYEENEEYIESLWERMSEILEEAEELGLEDEFWDEITPTYLMKNNFEKVNPFQHKII
jgi:peptidoglycan hydrolase CwlO-like protein